MWTWEVFQIDNTKATPNFIIKLLLSLKWKAGVKQHTLYYPTIKHKWCHGPSNFQWKTLLCLYFSFILKQGWHQFACGWHPFILLINMKSFTYATHATFWLAQNVGWTPSIFQIQNPLKINPIQVKTQFLPLAPTLHHYHTRALWIEKHKFMFLITWTNRFSKVNIIKEHLSHIKPQYIHLWGAGRGGTLYLNF